MAELASWVVIRSPSRLRLRPPGSYRGATGPLLVVAAILLAIGGVVAGLAIWMLAGSMVGGPVRFLDEVVPTLVLSGLAMFIAYLFGFPGYVLLEQLREAWWLDGTSLGYRRVLRTGWVDLATARVTADWHRATYRLGAVSKTGREVTLPVQDGRGALPPDQLTALAEAIQTGRAADEQAAAVAERLRRLVSEPDAILPGAGTTDPVPARRRGPTGPILLLGLAVLLLLVSVSGARWVAEEAHRLIEFRQAGECLAAPGPAGCRTDPAARIEDASYCGGRYCGDTRTRYVLQLSGGGTVQAEFRHRVEGPAEGDEVAVRLFQDRVVALHDGSAWVDTKANPRIALPATFAIASGFVGAGVGALIGAVATAGVRGGWWRRSRDWGWIGLIWFWTPIPSVFVAVFFGSPPIWALLLVDAAAAIAAIAYFRRRRSRSLPHLGGRGAILRTD